MGQGPGKYTDCQKEICGVDWNWAKIREGWRRKVRFTAPGPGHWVLCPSPVLSLAPSLKWCNLPPTSRQCSRPARVCSCLHAASWALRGLSIGIESFSSLNSLSDTFPTSSVGSTRCPEELQGWALWDHVESCAWLGSRRVAQFVNHSLIRTVFFHRITRD